MIYTNSKIQVIDNTGIRLVKCIKLYKYKKYNVPGKTGDIFLASIRNYKYRGRYKYKKGQLIKAVIVRTRYFIKRKFISNLQIKADTAAAVVLNNNLLPRGTRVKQPVFQEIRNTKYKKILSIAKTIF